jgi:hypothetical protein
MHGSHGQELGNIYSIASENAPILTISQQILTASHFGQPAAMDPQGSN